VEALILVIDMGAMLYLCWRLFKAGGKGEADLGFLRFDESDRQR